MTIPPWSHAGLPPGPPLLQVVVDTEEEFDWNQPFDRNSRGVTAMQAQPLLQDVLQGFGVRPTYVVDHPVATTPDAAAVLAAFLAAGACQIGTHLHPWVNPPDEEAVSAFNSYPGNLPPALERRKIEVLTEAIAAAFGSRPTIYKAGRYGVGPATPDILRSLGYEIDLSVVPHSDFGADGGPDFRGRPDRLHWIGAPGGLLEIPLSCGFAGALWRQGDLLHPLTTTGWGRVIRLGGVMSRLGLVERVVLTPEGVDFAACRRLVRAMLGRGHRLFTLAWHSPSLVPGHTPYVRSAAELGRFVDTVKRVLALFMEELGAQPTTPAEVRRMVLGSG